MEHTPPALVWFRNDLRLGDNPALTQAVATGQSLILVYIVETDAERDLGAASQWWLHHSLTDLSKTIADKGGKLLLCKGASQEVIPNIIEQTGASHVFWNRRYTEDGMARDKALKSSLSEQGIKVESFNANLLTEPWEIKTKTGGYYKVFSPYWRAVRAEIDVAASLPAPKTLDCYDKALTTLDLNELELLPTRPDWGEKMRPYWEPGEAGARKALDVFLEDAVLRYKDERNRPDKKGTSQLSPHLAFGEISPRQIWNIAQDVDGQVDKFLSEIGWREFSYVLLYHNPKLASENYKSDFDAFPWDMDAQSLERWQTGQTGYPFVDAGMRELWGTGWQHNRVRMVTASFLIKHLLLDWREGEAWFWDTLIDADPANNAASWQWVAGSGADAAPYFRIFNPFTQGEKFDPNGEYVRKWVPELARLPNKFIHRPWEAPALVLKEAGVELGENYPKPIVDHKFARDRALDGYKQTREEP